MSRRGSIPAAERVTARPTNREFERPTPGVKLRRPAAPAPMPGVTFRPTVAVGGPFAAFLDQQAANRAVVAGARDLRSEARQRVDRVWDRMVVETKERFGRSPSAESWEQSSDGALVALNAARSAETELLRLQAAGADPRTVDQAFGLFCSTMASWINYATRGWPLRKVYERQQRDALDDWNR